MSKIEHMLGREATPTGTLPTGDRGANLEKAIACFEAALRVQTEREFPLDWAATQNSLGIVYGHLPMGNREENLRNAITCYEAAARGYEAAGLSKEAAEVRKRLEKLRKDQ